MSNLPTQKELDTFRKLIAEVRETNTQENSGFRKDPCFRWALLIFAIFCIFALCFILLGILSSEEEDFVKSDRSYVSVGFEKSSKWQPPKFLDADGRMQIYMTGAGGGGCTGGSTMLGGGGSSGVSVANYNAIIRSEWTCNIIIGEGGQANSDGTSTKVECLDEDEEVQFSLELEGGRSGCLTLPASDRRGPENQTFYVQELFGARQGLTTNTTFTAEDNIYGGKGGRGLNGGAGSVFGTGGSSIKTFSVDAEENPYFGGGGFGGQAGFGLGGQGGNGKVVFYFLAR